MENNWVKDYVNKLLNCDIKKDAIKLRDAKLQYINKPLYKYCSVCENAKRDENTIDYNIDNLEKDLLYFQSPIKFNDPFDCFIGFSETKTVKDFLIRDLKAKKQYNEDNKQIIELLFSDDKYNFTIDEEDFYLALKSLMSVYFNEDDPMQKICTDVFTTIHKNHPYIFAKLINKQPLTILDRQIFIDILFQNEKYINILNSNTNSSLSIPLFQYEMKLKQELIASETFIEDNDDTFSIINIFIELSNAINGNNVQPKDFDRLKENFNSASKETLHKIRTIVSDLFKITCFSEHNDSNLMWSHYANKHYGFCLEYDFTATLTTPRYKDLLTAQLLLLPVEYSNKRPLLSDTLLSYSTFMYYKKHKSVPTPDLSKLILSLLRKGENWGYEKEWRIIDFMSKDNFMKLPPPRKIFLGVNIEDSTKCRLLDIATKKKIPVYQMYLAPNNYKLDYYKIQ